MDERGNNDDCQEDYIMPCTSQKNPVKWILLFQFTGGRLGLGEIKQLALGHTKNKSTGQKTGVFDAEALGCTHYATDYTYLKGIQYCDWILFMHTIFQERNHVLLQNMFYKKIINIRIIQI